MTPTPLSRDKVVQQKSQWRWFHMTRSEVGRMGKGEEKRKESKKGTQEDICRFCCFSPVEEQLRRDALPL